MLRGKSFQGFGEKLCVSMSLWDLAFLLYCKRHFYYIAKHPKPLFHLLAFQSYCLDVHFGCYDYNNVPSLKLAAELICLHANKAWLLSKFVKHHFS